MPQLLVEPDERGRVSLARVTTLPAERYVATQRDDGTIVLQPAVVLTRQALEALLAAQRSAASSDRVGSSLKDFLARHTVEAPTPEVREAARRRLDAQVEAAGRSVGDLAESEIEQLRRGEARAI